MPGMTDRSWRVFIITHRDGAGDRFVRLPQLATWALSVGQKAGRLSGAAGGVEEEGGASALAVEACN